jgi:GNAT superfamily N-acetyltransferase
VPENLRIRHHGRKAVQAFVDDVVSLYGHVFAEPPYNEGHEDAERFRSLLHAEFDEPGFGLVGAWDGDLLVGMAYGFTKPAGVWWSDAPEPSPTPDSSVFAVMEFGVHPAYRGRGLGRQLHDQLLLSRPESSATLKVWTAAPVREVYLQWGWRQFAGLTDVTPPVDILVLTLDDLR